MSELHPQSTRTHSGKVGVFVFNQGVSLSLKQTRMLDLAMRIAETTDTNSKHGAVIVRGGRVLSVGISKWRNRNLQPILGYNPNVTVHAEIDALSRVSDAKGATIYVARVNNQGERRMSRPCATCEKALNDAGVKRVIYTVP